MVNAGFIDDDLTISGLLPVALIARPSLVLKNSTRNISTRITATSTTARVYMLLNGVSISTSFILVNTVSVLLRLSSDELPITAILMEYNPVFTIIPASRLSIPILV